MNDSESIAESFAKTTVCENDNLEMIGQCHVGGIPIKFEFLHGISFAFYFEDPEGNAIEVFWPTGLEYHPQPYAQKIDLTKTEEELMKELKALTGQKDFISRTNPNKALWEKSQSVL